MNPRIPLLKIPPFSATFFHVRWWCDCFLLSHYIHLFVYKFGFTRTSSGMLIIWCKLFNSMYFAHVERSFIIFKLILEFVKWLALMGKTRMLFVGSWKFVATCCLEVQLYWRWFDTLVIYLLNKIELFITSWVILCVWFLSILGINREETRTDWCGVIIMCFIPSTNPVVNSFFPILYMCDCYCSEWVFYS
jgi:hypothetical protein